MLGSFNEKPNEKSNKPALKIKKYTSMQEIVLQS